jgi:hypothetical protein
LPGATGAVGGIWKIVALCAIGLWLLTLAAWLVTQRRQRPRAAVPSAVPAFSPTRRSFEQAVAAGDVRGAAQRLLAWARSEGLLVQHLGELSAQLDSAAQREAIAQLQAALYGGRDDAPLPRDLAACFAQGFTRVPRVAANEDGSVLPPLWRRG